VDFMAAMHQAYDHDSSEMLLEQHLQRFTISNLPASRVAWAHLLGAMQIAISAFLLVVGGLWLATTTRSSDLVLNAVALSYIMEIDELIFVTIVPRQVHDVISNLEPLPFRRFKLVPTLPREVPLGSIVALTGMTIFVVVMVSVFLDDHIQHVNDVVRAICGE